MTPGKCLSRNQVSRKWKGAMAFIPIPNAVEIVLYFTLGGQQVAMTLGVKRTGPATEQDLTDLIGAVDGWRIAELVPRMASDCVATFIKATALDSASAPVIELPAGSPTAGSASGAVLPNNVAVAIRHITDLRGRSYRGRSFLPGQPESIRANSVSITPADLASRIAAFVELADALATVSSEHAVLSRFTNGAPRTTGVATPVTAYGGDVNLDSQRRRLANRGT